MANRNFNSVQALSKKVVELGGIISIAADASVSGETILGASVAKTGTGQYTITLEDSYPELLACNLTLAAATAVNLVPQIVSADVVSAKTIVFKLLAVATATDPSAVCKVHVSLKLKNSGV